LTLIARLPYPPRLAKGVELLGEFEDSGYHRPPSLVRRADGQVIQLSRLLYLVARRMDGRRGPVGIANLVSKDLGRPLSPAQVCYLVVAKLAPLGIAAWQRPGAARPTADPLLTPGARGTAVTARAATVTWTPLRPLLHWPVVAAVIAGMALGYLLLRLPAANRALWLSTSHSSSQIVNGLAEQQYAAAAVSAIGAVLAALSIGGSLYIATGLARRAVATGRRWSAGRQDRGLVTVVAGAGSMAGLVAFWVAQGQFTGW
jgi:hypothetical protein